MASTVKHLRSSTSSKRPTASGLADGQLAINTASGTPGLFLKNSAGAVVKVGPAHVGASAPNATPAGSAGNSTGELWVNNSTTINGLNYYTGSAFVNLTPSGTTTVAGLVELATNAETQTGTDTVRAVTPSGLQSKLSNSISTTSSTTIASSTAVKTAYDLANAALPKAGGRITGNLEIGPVGSLSFEGSSDDGFETTLAVVNPTADRTITLPNVTGTVITTGDSGTVTSAMIADGTIVNADVNASAAIAGTKIAPNFGSQTITTTGVISSALGTAAAPSIAFTGDLNTGIFSPGADQVAVATNGAGRLFVDASGRVGIGQSSPSSTLDLNVGSSRLNIDHAASNAIGLNRLGSGGETRFTLNNTTDSKAAQIRVNWAGQSFGTFESWVPNNTSNGQTKILEAGTDSTIFYGSTAGAERLRITSAGLVGIGTSSPTTELEVVATNPTIKSRASGNNSGKLAVDSNRAASVIGGQILGQWNGNTVSRIDFYNGADGTNKDDGELAFSTANNASSPVERMRITQAGNVGIGTTSPAQLLEVSSTAPRIRLTDNDATASTATAFVEFHGSDARAGVIFSDSAGINIQADAAGGNNLGFRTSGSNERARIDSSGRLLVGTSTSVGVASAGNAPFQISTSTIAAGFYSVANSVGPGGILALGHGRTTSAGLLSAGDVLGEVRFAGGDGTDLESIGAQVQAVVDGTPGANDMPGRLVFSVTAAGASVPTERLRITSAGVLQIADAGNISVGTTTGTKIGTATTQKLGFYNATPVVQPAAVANATDAATVITQLNDLLAKLRTLGIIAT